MTTNNEQQIDPIDYCAIHGYEPIPEDVFRICGECHHAYKYRDLLIEANKIRKELRKSPYSSTKDITACPLCLHDF